MRKKENRMSVNLRKEKCCNEKGKSVKKMKRGSISVKKDRKQ